MTLPCTGAGITLVDPGPSNTARLRTFARGERFLRAYVAKTELSALRSDTLVHWKCGFRKGIVRLSDEGITWVVGHGDKARAALIATRTLLERA